MELTELRDMLKSGIRPIIQFTSETEKYDYDPDVGMRARVISCSEPDRDGCLTIVINMAEFVDYNKQIAPHNWFDKDNNPTLTWFDMSYYPSDHIYDFCWEEKLGLSIFEFVEESPLYEEYKKSGTTESYVLWLEKIIIEQRKATK